MHRVETILRIESIPSETLSRILEEQEKKKKIIFYYEKISRSYKQWERIKAVFS